MPTYQYTCGSCDALHEVVQGFHDAALTTCPTCHAEALRKVYGSVGVVFKGGGFYRTDSRAATGSTGGAGGTDSAGASGSSTGDSGPSTSASTPPASTSSATPSAS